LLLLLHKKSRCVQGYLLDLSISCWHGMEKVDRMVAMYHYHMPNTRTVDFYPIREIEVTVIDRHDMYTYQIKCNICITTSLGKMHCAVTRHTVAVQFSGFLFHLLCRCEAL
jgi:hypothetical protein